MGEKKLTKKDFLSHVKGAIEEGQRIHSDAVKFGGFLKQYSEANPEWPKLVKLLACRDSIIVFKNAIEEPKDNITWDNPKIEVRFGVDNFDWDTLDIRPPEEKLLQTQEDILGSLHRQIIVHALNLPTHLWALFIIDGKEKQGLHPDLVKELESLPLEKRDKRWEQLYPKPLTNTYKGEATNNRTGKLGKYKLNLIIQFDPIVINLDTHEVYYPIYIDIEATGLKPSQWAEKDRQAFWEKILGELEGEISQIPEVVPEFELPKPTAIPSSPKKYIPASTPMIRQTIGKPDEQLSLFRELIDGSQDLRQSMEDGGITEIGASLKVAEREALQASLTLLGDSNSINITPAEFYEAYGVTKFKAGRETFEYSSAESKHALKALEALRKPIVFTRKKQIGTDRNGKPKYDVIATVEPILMVRTYSQNLTEGEAIKVESTGSIYGTKLTQINIEKTLVSRIGASGFLLYDATLYPQIKQSYGTVRRDFQIFIDYLHALSFDAPQFKCTRSMETLYRACKLDHLLDPKRRQGARAKGYIQENLERAKELGILSGYTETNDNTGNPQVVLELSKDYFQKKRTLPPKSEQIEGNRRKQ